MTEGEVVDEAEGDKVGGSKKKQRLPKPRAEMIHFHMARLPYAAPSWSKVRCEVADRGQECDVNSMSEVRLRLTSATLLRTLYARY